MEDYCETTSNTDEMKIFNVMRFLSVIELCLLSNIVI